MPVQAMIDELHDGERATTAGFDCLGRYLDEIGRHPLLTRADEVRLARQAESGDRGARTRLVEANLRLVVTIARRYAGQGVDLLDLIQEGNIGLMSAAERFDWRQDVRFATYAAWWIRRAVIRVSAQGVGPVRLPDRFLAAVAGVRSAERALEQRLRRSPTVAELAVEAGVEEDVVAEVRRTGRGTASLDEPADDRGGRMAETLPDTEGAEVAAGLIEGEERAGLTAALASLPDRSRRVIVLRFGLDGDAPNSLEDVADRLGLSRERVRQVEARTLRDLAVHPDLAPVAA